MAKRTKTSETRQMTYKKGHNKNGNPTIRRVKKEKPEPAEPRKKTFIMCGSEKVPVMLSKGQIINPVRFCKRLRQKRLAVFMNTKGK